MRYVFPLMFLLCTPWVVSAQVTDNDIVKSILGTNFYNLNHKLDSLGVWYHHNFHENKVTSGQETKAKIYSIADGQGRVKVYIFHLHPVKKLIEEVVINFRHDSKEQLESMKQMPPASDYHVGTYSTDLVYKWKK